MLITILIYLIVIVAIAAVAFWVIDSSMPEHIRWIAKLIVGVIALIALVYLLQGHTGVVI